MPITNDREFEVALEEAVTLLEQCEGREGGTPEAPGGLPRPCRNLFLARLRRAFS